MMTVAELIEELKQYPDYYRVVVGGRKSVKEVTQTQLGHDGYSNVIEIRYRKHED